MNNLCALCGSTHNHILFRGRDMLHGLAVQSNVLQCNECGLIYLWPRPATPLESYPDEYAPHLEQRNSDEITYSAGHRSGLLRKARVVSQYGSAILLDIGCASGEFLAIMRGYDQWPLLGMDISPKAVHRAYKRSGLPVWVGDVPRLPLPDESVGTVTLWHVLEHLPQPLMALQEIARVLRPDGVLALACPMVDSYEAKLFGRYWSGYDVPRHLFAYSRRTLPRLLRNAGFSCAEVLHVVWGYNSARISSGFWLQELPIFQRNPRFLRLAATLTGGGAAIAFELMSKLFGNRRAVAVFVARKHSGTGQR